MKVRESFLVAEGAVMILIRQMGPNWLTFFSACFNIVISDVIFISTVGTVETVYSVGTGTSKPFLHEQNSFLGVPLLR